MTEDVFDLSAWKTGLTSPEALRLRDRLIFFADTYPDRFVSVREGDFELTVHRDRDDYVQPRICLAHEGALRRGTVIHFYSTGEISNYRHDEEVEEWALSLCLLESIAAASAE